MSIQRKSVAAGLAVATYFMTSAYGASAPQRLSDNAHNPATSVILNVQYAPTTNDPEGYAIPGFPLGGEAGLGAQGLAVQESELVLSSNIDDLFYGNVTAALHSDDGETAIELEEAFIETLGLGLGITVKAGRFFPGIGYLNEQHPHTWDFVDNALPYRALLGNQWGDDGVQLRWLAPADLFLEFGVAALRGVSYPAAGAANDGVGATATFAHVGGDIGTSSSWRAGLSGLWAQAAGRSGAVHAHGSAPASPASFDGDVDVAIVDFVWKWAPHGNATQRNVKVQFEYLRRNEQGDVAVDNGSVVSRYSGTQLGWYLQAVYQFIPRWRVGARYDRLASDNDVADAEVLDEAGLNDAGHTPQRASVMLDYDHSEFSRLRLQYNYDQSRPATDQQIFLQYVVSLGAHGAHQF